MEEKSQALVAVPQNPINNLSAEAKSFYQFHGAQMVGSNFPPALIQALHLKLVNEAYDGGQFFEIIDNGQQETFEVRAKTHIPANGNVFLIDHALTFRYPQLRKLLRQNPKIMERLEYMLKYQNEKKIQSQLEKKQSSPEEELEFDNMDLMDISALEFPKNLLTLSLIDNKLQNPDEVINKLQYLNLRILWLNNNTVAEDEKLIQYVNTRTRIQMFNSKFTKHCTEWGLKYAHYKSIPGAYTENGKVYNLDLDDRDIYNVDYYLFESFTNLRSISLRGHSINNQDQFKVFAKILELPSLRYIYVDQQVEIKIREAAAKGQLDSKVLDRVLINKHSFKRQYQEGDLKLDQICDKIFRLANCYRLASTQQLDQSSCWYVNDELGACIPHSDTPNVKLIPFLYAPNNKLDDKVISYTLLWPTQQINEGDTLTRDYLNGISEQKQRSVRMAAWYRLQESKFIDMFKEYDIEMFKVCADSATLLEKFYNKNALDQMERASKIKYDENKLTVYSDYPYINEYLKHQEFQIVDSPQKAKIIWRTAALDEEEWPELKKQDFIINQFPFESCVVMKQNLADTIQSVFGDTKFLMKTYNLEKQLKLLIGDYYQREKESQDNLWILKPPNMARSMDMIITDNLSLMIRNMETGPKIAQKYITSPVLRKGRKVDLRYILLVKSISPLMLYLYKNFWIRSANNDYTVDRRHLSTYETQFTVMNYGNVSAFEQIDYKEFVSGFESDYKVNWTVINEKIKKMLRNTFIAVATKYPEMHNDNSRAVYGIDIMIDADTMEPKLLEITFSPDCKRACEYYPDFYNDVFHTLYLETKAETMERII